MSFSSYRYRYFCTTEGVHVDEWLATDAPVPSVCFNNAGHSIDADSRTIVGSRSEPISTVADIAARDAVVDPTVGVVVRVTDSDGSGTAADFEWNGQAWDQLLGQVSSVNSKAGAVVLDTDDLGEGASNKFYTDARVAAHSDVAAGVTHAADASLHRTINDSGSGTTDLWSADKIGSAINGACMEVYEFKDERSTGSNGGSSSYSSWQNRDLNTINSTGGTSASLANNEITLSAGSYQITAISPGYRCGSHRCRIRNITDSTYEYGSSAHADDHGRTSSNSVCVFSANFASPKTLSLETFSNSSHSSGLGLAVGVTGVNEVYAQVKIVKLSG